MSERRNAARCSTAPGHVRVAEAIAGELRLIWNAQIRFAAVTLDTTATTAIETHALDSLGPADARARVLGPYVKTLARALRTLDR